MHGWKCVVRDQLSVLKCVYSRRHMGIKQVGSGSRYSWRNRIQERPPFSNAGGTRVWSKHLTIRNAVLMWPWFWWLNSELCANSFHLHIGSRFVEKISDLHKTSIWHIYAQLSCIKWNNIGLNQKQHRKTTQCCEAEMDLIHC